MYRLAIMTVSSSGYTGDRIDTGSQAISEVLSEPDYAVVEYCIVDDDKEMISEQMTIWADRSDIDILVSTGGTGLGPRDVTPEACLSIIDKEVPGLAESMRSETLKFTPMSMLSRSVAGIRGSTLILTLPGSPKAVKQTLEVVKPVLPHAIELLRSANLENHPN
ncbi:MAG: molybdenum cofactor biosynthesis protein [Dehalococcoidia bacterium]|nr:molybdenum cofactor biosynthesis protein [Dehalococcoidia bacterium]